MVQLCFNPTAGVGGSEGVPCGLLQRITLFGGLWYAVSVCVRVRLQQDIAKLLRFESSILPPGELTSLDEYISRLKPGTEKIYYLVAPHRQLAEASPYMEAFKKQDGESEETEVRTEHGSGCDYRGCGGVVARAARAAVL